MQADKHLIIALFVGLKDYRGIMSIPGIMPQRLRLFMGGAYLFMGTMSLILGSLLLYWRMFHNDFFAMAVIFLLFAVILLPLSLRILWVWRKLRTVTPLDVCSQQFGTSPERLRELVMEYNIRPQASVAGQDYFRLKDFGDISTLLRASEQPIASQDTLLRAAE